MRAMIFLSFNFQHHTQPDLVSGGIQAEVPAGERPVWVEKPRKNGIRCQTPSLEDAPLEIKSRSGTRFSTWALLFPRAEGQVAGEASMGEAGQRQEGSQLA